MTIPLDVPGLHQKHDGPGPLEVRLVLQRRLQELRYWRGLSLRGLAARSGVSLSTLHRIENGARMPTRRTVARLAAALQVGLGALFRPDARRKDQRPVLTEDRR